VLLVIPVIGFHCDFFQGLMLQVGVTVMIYQHLFVKELFEEESEPARDNNNNGFSDFTPQKTLKKKFSFFSRN